MGVATASPVEIRNRIGGELVPATSGAVFECRNPADSREVVSVAADSGPEDVDAAVSSAVAAQEKWASTPVAERARLLERAAANLETRADEIGREMVAEMGKPYSAARGEVIRTADNLRLYAGEAMRLQGRTFPADRETTVITLLDPVGVVGVITPWNFPISLASRKIGPALAAGNTVVFKPSSMTPMMGDRVAGAFYDVGLPAGVLEVVNGFGAGALVVGDERVEAVTFTGSTAVGHKIHAAMGLGRRVQLELGGNNPIVVLGDADLEEAARVVTRSAFSLSGQACTAAGRIIVEDAVHDDLLERVVARAEDLVVAPGNSETVDMGPLIDERAVESMQAAVDDAVAGGATVATGGKRLVGDGYEHGWFYPPTVLAGVTSTMNLSCTEVFGPVVGFERVADPEMALESANDTEYGLTASVCTTSLASALRFVRDMRAGIVRVNRPTVGTLINAPFGGIKESGTGTHKEQLGPTVMDFFTQSRTAIIGM